MTKWRWLRNFSFVSFHFISIQFNWICLFVLFCCHATHSIVSKCAAGLLSFTQMCLLHIVHEPISNCRALPLPCFLWLWHCYSCASYFSEGNLISERNNDKILAYNHQMCGTPHKANRIKIWNMDPLLHFICIYCHCTYIVTICTVCMLWYILNVLAIRCKLCAHSFEVHKFKIILPHLNHAHRTQEKTNMCTCHAVLCEREKKLQYIMLLCGVICSFARPFTRFSFWLNGKCFIAMRHKMNFLNCLSLSAYNFTGKAGQLYFVLTMSIAKLLISPFLYI